MDFQPVPVSGDEMPVQVLVAHGWASASSSMRQLLQSCLPGPVRYVDAPDRQVGAFSLPGSWFVHHRRWVDKMVSSVCPERPALLVGYSWGGAVALRAAADLPLAHALLVCPTALPAGTRAAARAVQGRVTVISGQNDIVTPRGGRVISEASGCVHIRIPGLTHAGFLRRPSRTSLMVEYALQRLSGTEHGRLDQRHAVRHAVQQALSNTVSFPRPLAGSLPGLAAVPAAGHVC